jgi:hypothetical protein
MESTNSQNRRSRRSQVLLAATIEQDGCERAVKLRNLSAEGALVEGADLPPEASEVLFRRNELSAPGRIVWVNDRYAGIAFAEKLAPEQVLRHIPGPRPRVLPRPWRPGFSSPRLTEDQRRLAESWVWSPNPLRPGE